eukprot:768541-Hanusia_phi.AAC.6
MLNARRGVHIVRVQHGHSRIRYTVHKRDRANLFQQSDSAVQLLGRLLQFISFCCVNGTLDPQHDVQHGVAPLQHQHDGPFDGHHGGSVKEHGLGDMREMIEISFPLPENEDVRREMGGRRRKVGGSWRVWERWRKRAGRGRKEEDTGRKRQGGRRVENTGRKIRDQGETKNQEMREMGGGYDYRG